MTPDPPSPELPSPPSGEPHQDTAKAGYRLSGTQSILGALALVLAALVAIAVLLQINTPQAYTVLRPHYEQVVLTAATAAQRATPMAPMTQAPPGLVLPCVDRPGEANGLQQGTTFGMRTSGLHPAFFSDVVRAIAQATAADGFTLTKQTDSAQGQHQAIFTDQHGATLTLELDPARQLTLSMLTGCLRP